MYNTVFKKLLDIGDIIGIKGYVFTTQTGEISIYVTEFKILTKSLRPLPIVKETEDKDGNIKSPYIFIYKDLKLNEIARKKLIRDLNNRIVKELFTDLRLVSSLYEKRMHMVISRTQSLLRIVGRESEIGKLSANISGHCVGIQRGR